MDTSLRAYLDRPNRLEMGTRPESEDGSDGKTEGRFAFRYSSEAKSEAAFG